MITSSFRLFMVRPRGGRDCRGTKTQSLRGRSRCISPIDLGRPRKARAQPARPRGWFRWCATGVRQVSGSRCPRHHQVFMGASANIRSTLRHLNGALGRTRHQGLSAPVFSIQNEWLGRRKVEPRMAEFQNTGCLNHGLATSPAAKLLCTCTQGHLLCRKPGLAGQPGG